MKCPFCSFLEDRVLDSRVIRDGTAIKRRRQCLGCERRYTTYETIEERRLLVVKKDGRREPFNRLKVLRGLTLACQKRPIGAETLERIVDDLERELYDRGQPEVPAALLGEQVVEALRHLDPVAYVRFASVYRDFQDVAAFHAFVDELRREARAAARRQNGAAAGRRKASGSRQA